MTRLCPIKKPVDSAVLTREGRQRHEKKTEITYLQQAAMNNEWIKEKNGLKPFTHIVLSSFITSDL